LILLAMLLNFLLIPSSSLTPLVVTKVYGKGIVELGWTETMFGVGVILGGLVLSAWGGFKRKIITSLVGVLGIGIGVILVGVAPDNLFYLILVANFVMGITQVFANGPLTDNIPISHRSGYAGPGPLAHQCRRRSHDAS
jgi:DHA3 family macrolide efflux protein-like MFS transporter